MQGQTRDEHGLHNLSAASGSTTKPHNEYSEAVVRMLEKRVSDRQARIRQQVEEAIREREKRGSPYGSFQPSVRDQCRGASNKNVEISYESLGGNNFSTKSRRKRDNQSSVRGKYKSARLTDADVFARLASTGRRNTDDEGQVPRPSAVSFRRSEDAPRVEDRLLGGRKEHQNWIVKQRFLQKSKELSLFGKGSQSDLRQGRRQGAKEKALRPIDSLPGFVRFQ